MRGAREKAASGFRASRREKKASQHGRAFLRENLPTYLMMTWTKKCYFYQLLQEQKIAGFW